MTMTSAAPRVAPSRRRRSHTRNRGYLFITPFIVAFVLLFLLPLGYAGYLSLFKDQLVGGTVWTTTPAPWAMSGSPTASCGLDCSS